MTTSIIFAGLLAFIFLMLFVMQFIKDDFDIRDVICSWDEKNKRKVISTSKSFLAGAFAVSSYVLIEHYSDTALGVYLTAWVANGGVVAWQKTKQPKPGVLK